MALSRGPLFSFPFVGLDVTVSNLKFSRDFTLEAARLSTYEGLNQIVKNQKPILMEPVMKTEIVLPEEMIGPVLSDLTGHRRANV